jgi:uncharacterized protein
MILLFVLFVLSNSCHVDYSNLPSPKQIRVGVSTIPNAGLGMFANEDIRRGSIIENCPMILLEPAHLHVGNPLWKYVFNAWYHRPNKTALVLGYCSMYNHSDRPNVHYVQDCDRMMKLIAIQQIKKGEEMFIDYGDHYWNDTPLLEYPK